jgi:hypothetical protein
LESLSGSSTIIDFDAPQQTGQRHPLMFLTCMTCLWMGLIRLPFQPPTFAAGMPDSLLMRVAY